MARNTVFTWFEHYFLTQCSQCFPPPRCLRLNCCLFSTTDGKMSSWERKRISVHRNLVFFYLDRKKKCRSHHRTANFTLGVRITKWWCYMAKKHAKNPCNGSKHIAQCLLSFLEKKNSRKKNRLCHWKKNSEKNHVFSLFFQRIGGAVTFFVFLKFSACKTKRHKNYFRK